MRCFKTLFVSGIFRLYKWFNVDVLDLQIELGSRCFATVLATFFQTLGNFLNHVVSMLSHWASSGSTVVKQLPRHPKVVGSSPADSVGQKNVKNLIFCHFIKAHIHYGSICAKLVGFKEQKKYFVILKPTKLAHFCHSVNTT